MAFFLPNQDVYQIKHISAFCTIISLVVPNRYISLRATFRDISNFCSTLFPDFILCFHMMKNYISIIKNPSTEVSGLKKAPKWIFEKKILIYRCDGPKKSLLVKNLQFLSYPHETWLKWLPHELVILTKFHEDRRKFGQ